ncbi:MAG: pyruvate, water dikinase [Desulfobacteraceae bacterium]|nr:MAG: pyruvate, water dikinase [Desulfobacteraceae bacterium]
MKILRKIYKLLMSSSSTVENLRLTFKARYHHFKVLLYANRKALGIMAEMEEVLRGAQPFGMSFVRAKCTQVSTNVFQIIKNMNQLAPEKYPEKYEDLYGRFNEIREKINSIVSPRGLPKGGPLVISLQHVDKNLADHVGGKMANLGEIRNRIHLPVPNGFVITAEGYQRFMEHNDLQEEIDRRIQAAHVEHQDQLYRLSSSIQQLIIFAPLPEDLKEAILDHYRRLEEEEGEGVTLAMRSSALGEDFPGISFAGQYHSELNVSSEKILEAYKEIIASKYSLQAMTYRLNRGIRDEDVAMCVGCIRMVDAISGGVAYSKNPVNIRDDSIVINSVWGLPKSVVDGSAPTDLFIISREAPMVIRKKEISIKKEKFVCYLDEGISPTEMTADEIHMASLSDEQALEIARLAVRVEEYSGTPQDIEWAIGKDGSIIFLQCRALQQMDVSKEEAEKAIEERELGSVILRGGVTASPGVAAGPVFAVKKDADVLQFPDGGVLVTAQSLPRWATLLNRAAAVVTQQGSIAGHLASVAREFSIPALFGVKEAIDRLRNGQWVTVDTDGLRVHEGRIDALLKRQEKPKNVMEGSPVFEALKGAARHITSLHLMDPDSHEFKPENCKTFHDITRFCHEKAVEEMFRFGKEHRFLERSSKQLICDVPMIYWVINLDDGFKEQVNGGYVRLEDIASIPMLAFWEGLMAVPWEGPPPVDSRGFMSVLLEATMNPALEPSIRSPYATRNYCMISKNFCTLQLRFGFHFCTVEALVGERATDNYIIFHFKGGAANLERRIFRARLLAQILEEYDFQTKVKEDAAFARLEGYDQSFMEQRLKVLGHLNMHTRQLDMAMSNGRSINHHMARIMKDLKVIVLKQ